MPYQKERRTRADRVQLRLQFVEILNGVPDPLDHAALYHRRVLIHGLDRRFPYGFYSGIQADSLLARLLLSS